jgi:hypothetical protein
VNNSLQSYQETTALFPPTGIANELKQVARLIKKRGEPESETASVLCSTRRLRHAPSAVEHAQCADPANQSGDAGCFYDEMVARGLADKVTQFTISDFGRTMNPAGTWASVEGVGQPSVRGRRSNRVGFLWRQHIDRNTVSISGA